MNKIQCFQFMNHEFQTTCGERKKHFFCVVRFAAQNISTAIFVTFVQVYTYVYLKALFFIPIKPQNYIPRSANALNLKCATIYNTSCTIRTPFFPYFSMSQKLYSNMNVNKWGREMILIPWNNLHAHWNALRKFKWTLINPFGSYLIYFAVKLCMSFPIKCLLFVNCWANKQLTGN